MHRSTITQALSQLASSTHPLAHLTLIKATKMSIAHHRNPFATKNMLYDDQWMEKHITGFTK